MEKTKKYKHAYFRAEIIKDASDKCFSSFEPDKVRGSYRLDNGEETWDYDSENEFFADYRKEPRNATFRKYTDTIGINIRFYKNDETAISVEAESREVIESIFEIFENHYSDSVRTPDIKESKNIIIFIGHGRSKQWRDLKDHLTDKHGFKVEAYETGARAGHTIRDILEEMISKSSFAILVMTGEDKDEKGNLRARQNVIHEIGLFQGKLGFSRAIVLLEDETEEFSNLHGIQQIRYSKGNIKETFGEILATLKREFTE